MDLKYELRACVPGVVTQDVREEPVIEFAADRIVGQTGDALVQRVGEACRCCCESRSTLRTGRVWSRSWGHA